jgi:hypothetical protein
MVNPFTLLTLLVVLSVKYSESLETLGFSQQRFFSVATLGYSSNLLSLTLMMISALAWSIASVAAKNST